MSITTFLSFPSSSWFPQMIPSNQLDQNWVENEKKGDKESQAEWERKIQTENERRERKREKGQTSGGWKEEGERVGEFFRLNEFKGLTWCGWNPVNVWRGISLPLSLRMLCYVRGFSYSQYPKLLWIDSFRGSHHQNFREKRGDERRKHSRLTKKTLLVFPIRPSSSPFFACSDIFSPNGVRKSEESSESLGMMNRRHLSSHIFSGGLILFLFYSCLSFTWIPS